MSIVVKHSIVIVIFILSIVAIDRSVGKFLSLTGSSSISVIRHIRLSTNNEYHRIRCPYHFNSLTVTLLNYSNDNCFDIYSTSSIRDTCEHHRSPCQFHAKSIRLLCHQHEYSSQVDITYQCSMLPTKSDTNA
jgi:hypothetical protein